jgi:hypothetical protein
MSNAPTFAVLGLYTDAQKIVDAANQIRQRKLGHLEAYTPYPVHGLDKAVGLPPSPLGKLVMGMGFSAPPWRCSSNGGRARWTIP